MPESRCDGGVLDDGGGRKEKRPRSYAMESRRPVDGGHGHWAGNGAMGHGREHGHGMGIDGWMGPRLACERRDARQGRNRDEPSPHSQ